MIKYLGSKRLLLPILLDAIGRAGPGTTVLDLFSGTSRVGHALKARGHRVIANDHNAYAHTFARCYVEADREDHEKDARKLIEELQRLPGRPGWFTATYAEAARFVHPKNAERVDAIREAIAKKSLPPELEAVVLTSLVEATDRVDSTTGVQMAYLKQWAPRATNDLELRLPELVPRAAAGKGEAYRLDAVDAAAVPADVAYVDPPYNQHSYLGNYHVWESLVLWDKPEVYGVAKKRIDVQVRKSRFNRRVGFLDALAAVLHAIRARVIVVSFNDEGYVTRAQLEALLRELRGGAGRLSVVEVDYKRYVGAQIGIHNHQGQKVGTVGRLRNVELVFVVE